MGNISTQKFEKIINLEWDKNENLTEMTLNLVEEVTNENHIEIKYFYNSLDNNEYLFIGYNYITIYLIKNENSYIKIIEEKEYYNWGSNIIYYGFANHQSNLDSTYIMNKFYKKLYIICFIEYINEIISSSIKAEIYLFEEQKLTINKSISFNSFKHRNFQVYKNKKKNIILYQ